MTNDLRRFAKDTTRIAITIEAIFYVGLGLLILIPGLWLVRTFGVNWFTLVLGFIFSFGPAISSFFEACRLYASAAPAQDEQLRYMQSKLMYLPNQRNDQRHSGTKED